MIDMKNNIDTINILALAYIGDAIYELEIRKHLIEKNITKVNQLQTEAIKYVSATNQAKYIKEMIENNFFTKEELNVILRARNHKSHKSKSTDIVTYKYSTALEAVIGYLYYQNNNQRIKEIMKYIKGE